MAAALAAVVGVGAGVPIGAVLDDRLPATAVSASSDAATPEDPDFAERFEHGLTDVEGVEMHHVVGGEGPPLVLLHGWPQTWFAWRDVMPALAEHHTVYALDLPGLGDSRGAPATFDKATLARLVHGLLERLGVERFHLAAHDLGAGVGFQYLAQFPEDVVGYVHMDYPLPSTAVLPADVYRTFSWHLAFNSQPAIPEALVDDPEDVDAYLEAFTAHVAYGGTSFGGDGVPTPFTEAELQEYARTYAQPEILSHGFELYRTLDEDQRDNDAVGRIATPTLLLTAEGALDATMPTLEPWFDDVVDAQEIPGAGHWLMEEQPDAVVAEILGFTR